MEEQTNKQIEEMTERFFALRFPEKDLEFEKQCGYFGEWVQRFASGNPEGYADEESLRAIKQVREELK